MKKLALLFGLAAILVPYTEHAQLQVYGAWHCGNDYCTWSAPRTVAEFDSKNHWLIERGTGAPSVNLVVLSFVHPLRLLNRTHGRADVERGAARDDQGDCGLF